MELLVKEIHNTVYSEKPPRYLIICLNDIDVRILENPIKVEDSIVRLKKVSDNMFIGYENFLPRVFAHNIFKALRHSKFIFTEIRADHLV